MAAAWEPHDLDRLVGAVDTLREMGVEQVVLNTEVPTVYVHPQQLGHVAAVTHRKPYVDPWALPNSRFLASLQFGQRLRLLAVCTAADLPELGYRVRVEPITPSEPAEEVTQGG